MLLVEPGEGLFGGGVDEEAVDLVEEIVAAGAVDGPVGGERLVGGEDFFGDDVGGPVGAGGLAVGEGAVDLFEQGGFEGIPVRGGECGVGGGQAAGDVEDVLALELVEVNPVIDEVNRTADLGVELIMSALGKRIL